MGDMMEGNQHTIIVDGDTADALNRRARDLGVSVAKLVASLAAAESAAVRASENQIAELDRRLAKAMKPAGTHPHTEVVQWLQT